MKEILNIDMDGVLADFQKAIHQLLPDLHTGEGDDYEERSKKVVAACIANPRIFRTLEPIDGAVEAVKELMNHFEVYFVSTPMEDLPISFTDKKLWLNTHFGELAAKRLVLTHRKDLVMGDYLIDDTTRNGAGSFKGELIQFGQSKYPDWKTVNDYLLAPYKAHYALA